MRTKPKSIKQFIRDNKKEIDEAIKQAVSNKRSLNNKEREQWILNDEGLYSWARVEGVKI